MRGFAVATAVAGASWLGAAAGTDAHAAQSCAARPVVNAFIAAFTAGDLARLEDLFATESEGWVWYFVNDPAGQRLGAASRLRGTLDRYFAERIKQHEELRLLRFEDSGNGNFTFVVRRRADDLRGGTPVRRVGKGWVSCSDGTIGVWGLGGAPTPATFGPCPRGVLPVGSADIRPAATAVLRFVRDVYSEIAPAVNVAGARVTRATLAPGYVKSYTARVKCGRVIHRRTIVIDVRFPRVVAGNPSGAGSFYASRTRSGWLVWRLIR